MNIEDMPPYPDMDRGVVNAMAIFMKRHPFHFIAGAFFGAFMMALPSLCKFAYLSIQDLI